MDQQIKKLVINALREDAVRNDITTRILIPHGLKIDGEIIAKEKGVACGLSIAGMVFKLLDKNIKFKPNFKDGDVVENGDVLARIYGKARSILSPERVALNLLAHLSGIATLTHEFVKKVKPYQTKILDTRKTTPNLRLLEKYAVRCGGGFNYRFDLSEQILIKDNHLSVMSYELGVISLKDIIDKARKHARGRMIETEVGNLREFKEALQARPDIIMLDNFTLANIKKAVKIRNSILPPDSRPTERRSGAARPTERRSGAVGRAGNTQNSKPKLEVSGRVKLANVRKIAACGVDFVSIGALTHSVKSLDFSLEIVNGC